MRLPAVYIYHPVALGTMGTHLYIYSKHWSMIGLPLFSNRCQRNSHSVMTAGYSGPKAFQWDFEYIAPQSQEDHVSMGSNAATKLARVVLNTERVLAIELMNGAQALEFRHSMTNLRSSEAVETLFEAYRKFVPFVDNDTVMYPHIATSVNFLNDYELTR